MRFKIIKSGALAVSLLLAYHLGLTGCSNSPQDGEELKNSEQANANSEGNTNDVADNEQGNDETANTVEDETANEATASEDGAAPGATESEQDLQEIISDLNGDASGGNAAGATAANPLGAPANNALAAAPGTNAATSSSSPSPMAAPSESLAAPTATSAAPAGGSGYLPETGSKMPYIVQKGDTLAKISEKIYGSAEQWQKIQELTKLNNPNKIYPGDVVYYQLENGSSTFAQQYESMPRKEVVVKEGDSLSSIAAQVYGNANAWKFLWRENGHIDNPDLITAGMVIYYKEFAPGTTLAEMEAIKSGKTLHKDLSDNSLFVGRSPANVI